jgi:16S rRNA G966 N2-methylase RsmD
MIQQIAKDNEGVTPITREIEGLKEYFPQCFNRQGEFDIDKFREAIQPQVDVTHEGRSYDFLGKSYARMLSSLDTTTVIRPDTEHNSKPENANSENIYISGDNLDALHHLVKSYAGQVKCIYIDPPYNTGTDGFVYNDKFKFTAEDLEKKLSISSDGTKELNVIVETKGVDAPVHLRDVEKKKISCAKKFFNQLREDYPELNLTFRDQLNNQQLRTIIDDVLREG